MNVGFLSMNFVSLLRHLIVERSATISGTEISNYSAHVFNFRFPFIASMSNQDYRFVNTK